MKKDHAAAPGAILGTIIALIILAFMHSAHVWTMLGFPYN